jgi:hypothetical protein
MDKVVPANRPEPHKGELVFSLKTSDGEYLCPKARWHRSIYIYVLRLSWSWFPVHFFCGWVCTDCDER